MVTSWTDPRFSEVFTGSAIRSVLRGMDGRARLGYHVRGHTGLGQRDTNQTVAGDDFDQLVFGPALGSFRADGHHHESMLLVGVLDSDLDLFWEVQPELRKYLARPAHDATTEVRCSIPLGGIAQNRTRVAGAQRADDDVVQGGRVFEHMKRREVARCPKTRGMQPVHPDFFTGCKWIRKDQLFVLRVKPGPGHQAGSRSRADLFSELGHAAVFLRSENPLLNAQLAKSDLQDFKVGDLIHRRRGGAIVIVAFRCHAEFLSRRQSMNESSARKCG